MPVLKVRAPVPLRAALAIALLLLVGWWLNEFPRRGSHGNQATPPSAADAGSRATSPDPSTSPAAFDTDRYDLAADEALGGHTLARHVGRTDLELAERLTRERDISAASTYTDRATAERVVAETLDREAERVRVWKARDGRRPNLALDYRGLEVIGRTLTRRRQTPIPSTNAVVVLRWHDRRGAAFVLTSYPEAR